MAKNLGAESGVPCIWEGVGDTLPPAHAGVLTNARNLTEIPAR